MKTKISIALVCISVLIFACRKSFTTNDSLSSAVTSFSIENAKSYLETSLNSTSASVKLASIDTNDRNASGYVYWKRARLSTGTQFNVVEVPVIVNSKTIGLYDFPRDSVKLKPDASVARAVLTRAVIYQNTGTKSIEKEILTYQPDKSYLLNHQNDASKNWLYNIAADFSGYIEFREWNGPIKYVLRMQNGKRVGKYKISSVTIGNQKQSIQSLKSNDIVCFEVCEPAYNTNCSQDERGDQHCTTIESGYDICGWSCYDTGGGYEPDPQPTPGDGGDNGGGFGGTPSTGNGDDVDLSVPDVAPSESDYLYTCPANFAFSSTTSSNLWQEGELTDIYCNLGVIDVNTGELQNAKTVQLQQVFFGVPYYTVEGNLKYTPNQAKEISADALNQAESDMRKKYAANPNLSSAQLGNYWVGRIDYYMRSYTNNLARAGRTGSVNPANKPPSKPYKPCE